MPPHLETPIASGREHIAASGVLVFESDDVAIQHNTFANTDVAAAASSWGWDLDSADNTRIQHNEVRDPLIGVQLLATVLQELTSTDPSVSNCKVVNNELHDPTGAPDGAVGVSITARDSSGGEVAPSTRSSTTTR